MAKTKEKPILSTETLRPYVQRAMTDPGLRDDLLAAFVAAWAGQQYQELHAVSYAVPAVGALASGVGLAFYGAAFQRKTKKLKL